MFRSIVLVLIVFAGILSRTCPADDPDQTTKKTDIESIRSEFEEVLIAKATDFSGPTGTLVRMSNLAKEKLQADDRFNRPVREVLQRYAEEQPADPAKEESKADATDLKIALELFELTTFPPDQAAELLFATILSDNHAIDHQERNRLRSLLSKLPDQTSQLVLEALRRGEQAPYLFWLTSITGEFSEGIAAELLEVAKSNDPERSRAALESLANVIDSIERRKQRQTAGLVSGTGEKYLAYARRIIGRYDRNQDGSLTKDEFESMLVSPEPADVDADGKITVVEYAKLLAERNSR